MRPLTRRVHLSAIALLLPLAVCSTVAQDLSLKEALCQVGLGNEGEGSIPKSKHGDVKYGFTYLRTESLLWEPKPQSWCLIVEKDTTEKYSKGSAAAKTEELTRIPYALNFVGRATATLNNQNSDWDEKRRMLVSGAKWLDYMNTWKLAGRREVAVGDGGVIGELHGYEVVLWAVSGHFCLRIQVEAELWIGGNRYQDPENIRIGSTTTRYPRKDDLVRKLRECRAQREERAVKLARNILNAWQQWGARKVGPGPELKGLYYDPRPYLLTEAEFPGTISVKRTISSIPPKAEAWASAIYEGYVAGKAEEDATIRVYLGIVYPEEKDPFESVLTKAAATFKDQSPLEKHYTPKAVTLRSADEAFAYVGTGDPENAACRVRVRRSNLLVNVEVSGRGYPTVLKLPDRRTLALAVAQRVLDKTSGTAGNLTAIGQQGTVELTATPPALWADGQSRARLQLTVKGSPTTSLPAEFELAVEGGGRLRDERLTVSATGVAETEYTASTIAGKAVVTATGPLGTARIEIAEGGIVVEPEQPGRFTAIADGTTPLPLIVRGTDLAGKPLVGLRVNCTADDTRLPTRGTLEPADVSLDAQGIARLSYTAPKIDPAMGFRRDDVVVTASAVAPAQPPANLTTTTKLTVFAGETATLEIAKDGFASPTSIPVSLRARNSLVRGRVETYAASGETFPVAFAAVRIQPPGARGYSNPVLSGPDGSFAIPCVGDLMAKEGLPTELPAPVVLPLDPFFSGVMRKAGEALNKLNDLGFDIRAAASLLHCVTERLAASDPKGDPAQTPAAIGGAAYRLGVFAVQLSLLHARQGEDIDWLMESVDPLVDELVKLLVQTEEIEKAAKEKLGKAFDANVWARFRKNAVGRCLGRLAAWLRKNTATLRALDSALQDGTERAGKVGEAVGIEGEGEEGLASQGLDMLHHAVNPGDALTGDLQKALGVDDLTGSARDLLADAIKTLIRRPLEAEFRRHAQGVLNGTVGRLTKGVFDPEGTAAAIASARDLFATYQENHTALNIRNLDAELYRLDTRLFMDTAVKGVCIYFNLRKLAAEAGQKTLRALAREKYVEIQDAMADCGEKINTAATYLDCAFRVYQGQIWLRDGFYAEKTLEAIAAALTR